MEKLGIGIIGAGRIGRIHAINLYRFFPEVEIVGIADIDLDRAMQLSREIDNKKVFDDPTALINHPDVHAILICSSTDTHTDLIIKAAKAEKDIFCEKPIALDIELIDEALTAVEESNVKLFVGFNRRFDPNFKKARELVLSGKIGKPHILKITSRDPEPPPIEYVKVSGGIFADMTIHDFDMARYLLNDEIVEVYATGNVLIDEKIMEYDDVDTAITVLKFRGGSMGVIDNSRKAVYGYDQRIEIFGSDGMISVNNKLEDETMIANSRSFQISKPLYFFLERYQEAYLNEMKEFVSSIINNSNPPVSGMDGKIAILIAEAAKKSLKERKPIKLEYQ
ncbi:MAG TPA: inositol 2-dehydrogenase [Thermotogaceae bacterium]|nr:inositol 2-dehydrogenase [Thermotogaceae bacterium]